MAEVKQLLRETAVGGKLQMGAYQGEELTWRVLDKQQERVLLIAEECVDALAYDLEWDETTWEGDTITWETCTLRKWLNEDFIQTAFSENEREMILVTLNTNEANPIYHVAGGNDTQDQVFILSVKEAEQYFASNEERKASATEYARTRKRRAEVDAEGNTWWWLRTKGFTNTCAVEVKNDGSISLTGRLGNVTGCGNGTQSVTNGVRPAMWVKL